MPDPKVKFFSNNFGINDSMRSILNLLYIASAILAGVSLVAIAGLVTIQVLARASRVVVLSTDSFAGYALAASVFLALPYTFKTGGHVRVSLLLSALNARNTRVAELWCLAIGACIVVYFAYFSLQLTIDFHRFGDVSSGTLVLPLWIPQSVMSAGLILFAVSIVDELVLTAAGRTPSYAKTDVLPTE